MSDNIAPINNTSAIVAVSVPGQTRGNAVTEPIQLRFREPFTLDIEVIRGVSSTCSRQLSIYSGKRRLIVEYRLSISRSGADSATEVPVSKVEIPLKEFLTSAGKGSKPEEILAAKDYRVYYYSPNQAQILVITRIELNGTEVPCGTLLLPNESCTSVLDSKAAGKRSSKPRRSLFQLLNFSRFKAKQSKAKPLVVQVLDPEVNGVNDYRKAASYLLNHLRTACALVAGTLLVTIVGVMSFRLYEGSVKAIYNNGLPVTPREVERAVDRLGTGASFYYSSGSGSASIELAELLQRLDPDQSKFSFAHLTVRDQLEGGETPYLKVRGTFEGTSLDGPVLSELTIEITGNHSWLLQDSNFVAALADVELLPIPDYLISGGGIEDKLYRAAQVDLPISQCDDLKVLQHFESSDRPVTLLHTGRRGCEGFAGNQVVVRGDRIGSGW